LEGVLFAAEIISMGIEVGRVDAAISKISNLIDENGLDGQAYNVRRYQNSPHDHLQIQLMSKEPRILKNLFQTC